MDIAQPLRPIAEQLAAARAANDGDAIAALYVEDGMLLLPDGARVQGRAAIAAHYKAHAQTAPKARQGTSSLASPAIKYYFFPPLAHAVGTVNGRHGEKHSFLDVFLQQPDGAYLVACSSWTLR